MNETQAPLLQSPAIQTLDPVDAAIQAALNPEGPTPDPVSESPVESQPEAAKPEPRKAREYAEAVEAKRRAAQAESRARQQAKEFKEQQALLAKQKADLEDLFTGAKGDKAKLRAILERSGHDLDSVARLLLDLDAAPVTADTKAEQALEEARALRKQVEEERSKLEEAQRFEHSQRQLNHYLKVIENELAKDTTDKYELVKERKLYQDVLGRSIQYLKDNGLDSTYIPPEEELLLINYIAGELEKEMFTKAESTAELFRKTVKGRRLMGISEDNSKASSEASRDNEIAADTDSLRILEDIGRDTTAIQRGNKFITQDSTVSSRPTTVRSSRTESDIDREIDELVKAAAGKKPL